MDVENTDLERRALAHEQILQVLIAHMAEVAPKFLDRLQQIFTKHHTLGRLRRTTCWINCSAYVAVPMWSCSSANSG
jgi:hypothetical protein